VISPYAGQQKAANNTAAQKHYRVDFADRYGGARGGFNLRIDHTPFSSLGQQKHPA
jgi:hypothetical protein